MVRQLACLCFFLALSAPTSAHEAAALRGVSVSGSGSVRAAPDRARLDLAVDLVGMNLPGTESEVNIVVRRYLAAALALGAAEADISTTGIQVQPEYRWDEKARNQVLIGYRVSREISVVVRSLDRLGDFVLKATESGLNRIQPPVLERSDAEKLERQALKLAAVDARARAQVLAETLGAKLGPVRRVSAVDGGTTPMHFKRQMVMAAQEDSGNARMGLSMGEIEFQVAVTAEFDLN